MIDSKELRIGNIIHYEGDETNEYNDEQDVVVGEITRRELLAYHLDFEKCYEVKSFSCFDPIPLTDDWLNKFGLEEKMHGEDCGPLAERCYGFKLSDHLFLVKNKIRDGSGKWKGYYLIHRTGFAYRTIFHKTIEHVHHLQNIVFDLTGQELTIK